MYHLYTRKRENISLSSYGRYKTYTDAYSVMWRILSQFRKPFVCMGVDKDKRIFNIGLLEYEFVIKKEE